MGERSEEEADSVDPKPLMNGRKRLPLSTRPTVSRGFILALSFIGLFVLLALLTSASIRSSTTAALCAFAPSPATPLTPTSQSLPPPPLPTFESLNHCRLLSALSRMRAGEALRFAAVGGSITRAGPPARSWLEIAVNRLNAAHPPKEAQREGPAFVRATYHTERWGGPSTRHLSRNLAMGGIPSSFVSTCLSAFFPERGLSTADVLFVEFAVNDLSYAGNVTAEQTKGDYFQAVSQGEMTTGGQVGEFDPATNMERIVRYALAQAISPDASSLDGPAVILVEFCEMDGTNAAHYHNPVAHHYGVPVISVCELLPFSYPADDEAGTATRQGGMMRDRTHPTLPGHAVASAMLTDRLLNQLLPQVDSPAVTGRCQGWGDVDVAGGLALSPTMYGINAVPAEYKCTLGQFTPGHLGDRLEALKFPAFDVAEAGAWEYKDETARGKWGWQTTQVNSTLSLRLQPSTRHLILSYLRSYANIGSARCWLTGTPGYVSASFVMEAWWPRAFSTFELMQLPQTVVIPQGLTALALNVQLMDAGHEVTDPPVQRPSNRFKLVGVFELAEKDT